MFSFDPYKKLDFGFLTFSGGSKRNIGKERINKFYSGLESAQSNHINPHFSFFFARRSKLK